MLAQAEKLDVVIEPADDFTLQLDIDSDEAYDQALMNIELLMSLGREHAVMDLLVGESMMVRRSKGGNRHVTLGLRQALSVYERLALQAILGSDPSRELLSMAGIRAGKDQPIVLFRPKETT